MVTFGEAVKTCLTKKYFKVSGRATRSEYWWFQLFVFLMVYMPLVILAIVSSPSEIIVVPLVFAALLIVPNFCVEIRRLHDAGFSGWCVLVNLIPYVGEFVLFVMTLLGSDKDNKWGPNPHNPDLEQNDEVIVKTSIDL